MPSAKYSISNPSAIIALKYGKNVSRGILEMQKKIVEQEEEINDMGTRLGESGYDHMEV